MNNSVVWFTEEACKDVRLAGGKGASLANMTAQGLPVPPGFVIPAYVLELSVDAGQLHQLAQAQNAEGAQALVRHARASSIAGLRSLASGRFFTAPGKARSAIWVWPWLCKRCSTRSSPASFSRLTLSAAGATGWSSSRSSA